MIKKLDLKLCNALVDTDFFLLNLGYKHNLKRNINNSLIKSLNIVSLLKSIKQFIRLLQFVQRSTSNRLTIRINNKNIFYLLKQFFQQYPVYFSVEIEQSFYTENVVTNNKGTKMLLMLDSFGSLNLTNILKRQFANNFLFLQNVDTLDPSRTFAGNYKIYSDVLDFKKIILIIVLIHEILKENNKCDL